MRARVIMFSYLVLCITSVYHLCRAIEIGQRRDSSRSRNIHLTVSLALSALLLLLLVNTVSIPGHGDFWSTPITGRLVMTGVILFVGWLATGALELRPPARIAGMAGALMLAAVMALPEVFVF